MTVREVIRVVEGFAPPEIQESWDNTGLQIGTPDSEVRGILLGLDCTPELVAEAVGKGCDMIITHHPLLFGGLRSIDPREPVGKAVIDAVKAGITVYAAHTSADKVPEGVSGAMARRLGLRDVEVLGDGLGAIGTLPGAPDAAAAIALVKSAFGLSSIRTSRPIDLPIDRVAVCGGSGSSLIAEARAKGARLYLCGDISYHHFFTPSDFMLADVGHFESEVDIVDVLYTLLRKNFPNFAVRTCDNIRNTNPVFYY